MDATPLLEVEGLTVTFPGAEKGSRLRAADGVNLSVYPAQTLAVVGESGSGKSVSAMSILQLIPVPPGRYDSGRIVWREEVAVAAEAGAAGGKDLLTFSDRQMRRIRGNEIAMIFQEPMTSLNPVYTIGDQILEAVRLHQDVTPREAREIAERALREVGIADPARRLHEYPHQHSGGMRQRVMIAMALACQPRLLLADEPTTALDATIQAQILELLRRLQREREMAVLLITHDLGVVAQNADVVAVMYAGRVVEYAKVEPLFARPLHPYTRGLLASMPRLGTRQKRLPTVTDGATIPGDFPSGYEVSPHVVDPNPEEGYGGADARLYEVERDHWVLCEARTAEAKRSLRKPRIDYRREYADADADADADAGVGVGVGAAA